MLQLRSSHLHHSHVSCIPGNGKLAEKEAIQQGISARQACSSDEEPLLTENFRRFRWVPKRMRITGITERRLAAASELLHPQLELFSRQSFEVQHQLLSHVGENVV